MIKLKIIFTIFISILSTYSLACVVPPTTLLSSDRELISRSPNIALAEISKHESDNSKYIDTFSFTTVKVIRGEVPKTFNLKGYLASEEENFGDFSKHQQPVFWAFSAGNSVMPGDCSAYGIYEVGKTYLIFFNELSHIRSFEEIKSKDDLWLNVVKLLIKEDDRW